MSYDVIARSPHCKHGAAVMLGNKLKPECAIEIIRVTDGVFWSPRPETTYELNVKRSLGIPLEADFDRFFPDGQFDDTDWRGLDEAQKAFRERWGLLDVTFLGCAQTTSANGWCYPDGTIAWADELDGWVYSNEMWSDCETLVNLFPEVEMSIAVWGDEHIFANGLMMHEAPESAWTALMRDAVRRPSHGIVIRNGRVEGVLGDDPRLFTGYGYDTYIDAIEGTFREYRSRLRRGVTETKFGDRESRTGLPDTVIESWIQIARKRGLVHT